MRIEDTQWDSDGGGGGVPGVRRARGAWRRSVAVDGAVGVLQRREGCWVLANDGELRVLEALGGSGTARGRLWAVAAALDAEMVPADDAQRLCRLLGDIASEEPQLVRVPDHMWGSVAYACVCWDHEAGPGWLMWALSARLDANLVRDWLPGPGWGAQAWEHELPERGFGRPTGWIFEMPEGFWHTLGSHHSEDLQLAAVASDPLTPRRVLAELADREGLSRVVLELVASHPNTPKVALEKIGTRRWGSALLRVAQNLSAGRRLLAKLATAHDSQVRLAVALHPNTAPGVRAAMAGDFDTYVRMAVARADDIGAETLAVLAADRVWVVRSWAAWNPHTAPATLTGLVGDRSATVRAVAVSNPATPASAAAACAGDRSTTVRAAVAARPDAGDDALEALATDPSAAVRAAVAANPAAPEPVLAGLAADDAEDVRAAAAGNDCIPAEALEALAGDASRRVRAAAAEHYQRPPARRRRLKIPTKQQRRDVSDG